MENEKIQIDTQAYGFSGLGIHEQLMRALANQNFKAPTPIQHQVIPVAIEGKDIIGVAQTGTGKTLAFGVPMIQRLAGLPGKQGLVIVPTRELAAQVEEQLQQVARGFRLKTALLIGGTGMGMQLRQLRANPHIIVATPGRLNDHLGQKNMHLNNMAILVLDEADHMFDMGFAPQIKKILALLPKMRQNMLFSATMPPEILKIAASYMQLPLRFEIAPLGTTAERIEQELFFVSREQRMPLLQKLLADTQGNALVFLRTKHNATKVCRNLVAANISAAELHSNRSLSQRRAALDGFKRGKFKVLVATDIASRGIDVRGLAMVINYDLPESAIDYVHRIGRTGRAGQAGKAVSFALPDQRSKIREIQQLIRYTIPVSQMPGLPAVVQSIPQKPHRHHVMKTHQERRKNYGWRSFGTRKT